MDLAKLIRDVPDFPKKGIIFKDITTLLNNGEAFRKVVDLMAGNYSEKRVDKVLAIESRGFLFGGVLAYKLGCGLVPARKAGKLPSHTIREEYSLEYGTNVIEIHKDAVANGERVVIVDDLLATGGTTLAAVKLVERLGGKVVGIEFLIELLFLNGKDKLKGYKVHSYIQY